MPPSRSHQAATKQEWLNLPFLPPPSFPQGTHRGVTTPFQAPAGTNRCRRLGCDTAPAAPGDSCELHARVPSAPLPQHPPSPHGCAPPPPRYSQSLPSALPLLISHWFTLLPITFPPGHVTNAPRADWRGWNGRGERGFKGGWGARGARVPPSFPPPLPKPGTGVPSPVSPARLAPPGSGPWS